MPVTKGKSAKKPIQRNLAAKKKAEIAARREAEKNAEQVQPKANVEQAPGQVLPDVTLEVANLNGSEKVKSVLTQGRKNLEAANKNLTLAQAKFEKAEADFKTAQMAVNGERKALIAQAEMIATLSGELSPEKNYAVFPNETSDLILCYEQKPSVKKINV